MNTSNPFIKARKQDYLTVLLGLVLIIVILIIVATTFQEKQGNQKQTISTQPSIEVSLPVSQTNDAIIKYNAQKQNDLYEKLQNRPTVSSQDNFVKTKLISSLGNETGMLYESDNIAISYIKSGDLFQVEILSPNIQTGKQEANQWFTNQGLSHEGMCNLPVVFFLNTTVANQLRNSNIIFSPLPNGC